MSAPGRPPEEAVGPPRRLTALDIPAFVAHLERQAHASGRLDAVPHGPYDRRTPFDAEEVAQRALERFTTPTSAPGWRRAFGVWRGERVVGHVEIAGGGLYAELHRVGLGLGVERPWRRQGHGRTLMRAALEFARALPGVAWVDLGVFAVNTGAHALYRELGFVEVGRVADRFRLDGVSYEDVQMCFDMGGR